MYRVYTDELIIHDSKSPDQNLHLISPTLKLQENAAGSFEFTIPRGQAGYEDIERMVSTIAVEKENEVIWTGRVVQESEDFYGRRKFKAEGALAYLNDSVQPNMSYDATNNRVLFENIIAEHNKLVGENRQFIVGALTIVDITDSYAYATDYESTWSAIKANFLDRLEGHLFLTYTRETGYTPIINYYADYPNLSSQTIDFGNNLLDFTKNWDLSNLATVIIPKGQMIEEVTDDNTNI